MPRQKKLLKQSHKLAQSQTIPTLIQSKGYKYLLYKALPSLQPGSIHLCSAYELRQALGTHDYVELKMAMENLSSIQIKWECLGRSEVIWGRSSLLSSCVLTQDGFFRYSFDPQTVQELIQPKRYKRLNLELMLGFQSSYALKIYEGIWQYFDPKKMCGRTPSMNREKLREWLNVPENAYKAHRDFFRRAVDEPLKEVNARGELIVSFHHDDGTPRERQYWFQAQGDFQNKLPFLKTSMLSESKNQNTLESVDVSQELQSINEEERQRIITEQLVELQNLKNVLRSSG
jgi:hypothetical protein